MKTNGGPAFPSIEFYDEEPVSAHEGMTLRDYFAIHSGCLQMRSFQQGESSLRIDAARAYRWADIMIEERDK